MTFKIYADNKYVETRDDIESCLAIVKYLYENYEIRRIRIESARCAGHKGKCFQARGNGTP